MRTRSIYGWESSYYGGYEGVVYDHPSIYLPRNMTALSTKPVSGGGYYLADKMVKIFVYKVVKSGLVGELLKGATSKKADSIFKGDKSTTIVKASSVGISVCQKLLSNQNDDFKNLIIHYKDIILSARIEWEFKDGDDDDGGGNGDGDDGGGNGDSGDGDSDGGMTKDMMEEIKKMMAEIREQKPYNPYSSSSISGDFRGETTFVNMMKTKTKWQPNAKVTLDANNLVRLLDISFDPKDDRIENLKCGKMSSHKIAEIPAGNTHVYHRVEENISTKPFSVCILVDESGSMKYGGLVQIQNHIMKVLYTAFSQIIPKDRIFIYGHTGDCSPEVHVYHDRYHPEFEACIDSQFSVDFRENYDGPVIEEIHERVRKQTSDNVIFIAISDGVPGGENYGGQPAIDEMKRIIEKCKRDGFVTAGVGLDYGLVKEIYNYHTIVTRGEDYVKKVSTLVNNVVKSEFKD